MTKDGFVVHICFAIALFYVGFEVGQALERKHVAACPQMNGKREVSQTVLPNGNVVCSYVRNVKGLATYNYTF